QHLAKVLDDGDLRRYSLEVEWGKSVAKRDFLAVTDLSRDEVVRLFDLAHRMKTGAYRETPLAGKTLAMIFAKSSTRTRVSFEVGTYQLGGQALFLSSRDIQLG